MHVRVSNLGKEILFNLLLSNVPFLQIKNCPFIIGRPRVDARSMRIYSPMSADHRHQHCRAADHKAAFREIRLNDTAVFAGVTMELR